MNIIKIFIWGKTGKSKYEKQNERGRQIFSSIYKIWTVKDFSKNTKIGIFNSTVKSILLYETET